MSASPFSFHCMICIEEFDPVERYPVVLPCGHTYLCNVCGERLDRCMECRTPLTYIVNPALQQQHQQKQQFHRWSERSRHGTPSNSGRRYNAPHSPVRPLVPPEKKRLPLPKNVVLLSLMEATQIVSDRAITQAPSQTSPTNMDQPSDSDDEARISVGTSLATGLCGTYMVTVHEGMEIYPCRPDDALGSQKWSSKSSSHHTDKDVDTLVRFFHLDNHLNSSGSNLSDEKVPKDPPPAQLKRGDRVQIVSVEHGWAKLARGYGYLRSDGGQLAKVGAPLDRACTLEALLRSLSYRRRELKKEHRRANDRFVDLMGDLQNSLVNDEDLTVIWARTFGDEPEEILGEKFEESQEEKENAKLEVKTEFSHEESTDLAKPHALVRQETPPPPPPPPSYDHTGGLSCFSVQVFQFSTPPAETRNDTSTRATSNASVLESLSDALSSDHLACKISPNQTSRAAPICASQSHPSPGSMAAGARAWRQQNGESVAARGIDWRTGMSGHLALTNRSTNTRRREQYLRNVSPRMKMSAHTGLTISRPRSQHEQTTASLSIPSFSEQDQEHERHQEQAAAQTVNGISESGEEETKEQDEEAADDNEDIEVVDGSGFFVGSECF